jgi:hypothetical protein
MRQVVCPHCGEPLGHGDEYDMMTSHLADCPSDKARRVRGTWFGNTYRDDPADLPERQERESRGMESAGFIRVWRGRRIGGPRGDY